MHTLYSWWVGKVDVGGVDLLNVKIILIGSNVVCTMIEWEGVLRMTWWCGVKKHEVGTRVRRKLKGQLVRRFHRIMAVNQYICVYKHCTSEYYILLKSCTVCDDVWQKCDVGYQRSTGGLYLGTCQPCFCNGHSTECGSNTGHCLVGFHAFINYFYSKHLPYNIAGSLILLFTY